MEQGISFSDKKNFYYEQVENDPKRSAQMLSHHYHSFFEVYYLEKGECNYFVGGRTYHAIAGDVVIIPEGVIHKTTYNAPYLRRIIYFTRHFLPSSVIKALPTMLYLYRNPDISDSIREIFDEIKGEYNCPDQYTEDSLKSLVYRLFFLLARNLNKTMEKASNSDFVIEAVKLVGDNYMSDITLKSMAQKLSVSPEHLSRTFKKETGFGFNEYLTLVRLQKAETMLREEDNISISHVSSKCGFNDSNYFSDKFKKYYGVSPLKYRKN
ncbi:MAG: helix-turn-helix domain-containing protein [Ruminococcaceae bacterium]|nr:helix-turn-helix domain-containing protein [Oscillospiraceae bacterium]